MAPSADATDAAPRPRSLSTMLVGLVLATAIPLLALAFYTASLLIDAERRTIREGLIANARALAAAVEAEVERHVAIAETLARSRSLGSGHLAAFRQEAEGALLSTPRLRVIVASAEGQQLLNTGVGAGQPLPVRGHLDLQRVALDTGNTQISDVRKGAVTGLERIPLDVDQAR